MVAPFAGAWIEIIFKREAIKKNGVAPFAGAWIEIKKIDELGLVTYVAPFAGAWIEIKMGNNPYGEESSHPSRVRGLKFKKATTRMYTVGRTLRGCVD